MAHQEIYPQGVKEMICEVIGNIKTEILTHEFRDQVNALSVINELITYMPQILRATDIPGNRICYQTTPTGWKLNIDATVDLKIDNEGCFVGGKTNNIKYYLIEIYYTSHYKKDENIHELDITTEYRCVDFPPLDGCTTLPEAIDSEILRSGTYVITTFDNSNKILTLIEKKNYSDGIYWICDWKKPIEEL